MDNADIRPVELLAWKTMKANLPDFVPTAWQYCEADLAIAKTRRASGEPDPRKFMVFILLSRLEGPGQVYVVLEDVKQIIPLPEGLLP